MAEPYLAEELVERVATVVRPDLFAGGPDEERASTVVHERNFCRDMARRAIAALRSPAPTDRMGEKLADEMREAQDRIIELMRRAGYWQTEFVLCDDGGHEIYRRTKAGHKADCPVTDYERRFVTAILTALRDKPLKED